MKNIPPKLEYPTYDTTENNYVNYGKTWSAIKLIEFSKQYETFDLPLAGIDLTRKGWPINDIDDFIHHANRVHKADLQYPIILDECGVVADGFHRIAKAIIMGKTTIKAIRLIKMPEPDSVEESK